MDLPTVESDGRQLSLPCAFLSVEDNHHCSITFSPIIDHLAPWCMKTLLAGRGIGQRWSCCTHILIQILLINRLKTLFVDVEMILAARQVDRLARKETDSSFSCRSVHTAEAKWHCCSWRQQADRQAGSKRRKIKCPSFSWCPSIPLL